MRVLVTRPREDAEALAAALAARGFTSLIQPLLQIVPRADAHPDLAGVQALLFTSANGARVFAACSAVRDLPVFAVGEASAAAARAAGFERVESADGDVAALAGLVAARCAPDRGPLFHGAAGKSAGDLAGSLRGVGFEVQRTVLYDARPADALAPDVAAALRDGGLAAVLFFSPRTAQTFVKLAVGEGLAYACAACRAVCLSRAVAAELKTLAWGDIAVADRPTQAALLDALTAAVPPDGEEGAERDHGGRQGH